MGSKHAPRGARHGPEWRKATAIACQTGEREKLAGRLPPVFIHGLPLWAELTDPIVASQPRFRAIVAM